MRAPASVLDALTRLRSKGWRLAIVANGSAMQAEKVAAAGLESAVDAVCVSDIEGYAKPDPTLLRIAAERAGGNLDNSCWLVGDSPSDIEAANNAGVRSVWLGRGRAWPKDDLRPDLEADSFDAAVALILGDAGEGNS